MTEIRNINSFGYYDNFIQTNFIVDHCGIDLSKLGTKTDEAVVKAHLDNSTFFNRNILNGEAKSIINFIQTFYKHPDDRPLWYKINVIDQAINEYIGIGHLNLDRDWLNFITTYLEQDRAEQGGDTILIVFDTDFKWAVSFTLSQDNSILLIEQFKK
jgi:hypothetical protein